MPGKSKSPQSVVADAFARAEQSGEWEPAKRALVETIAACEAKQLAPLFRHPALDEGMFGEAEVWAEVVDALLDRAERATGKDAGVFAGWVARACAMRFVELVGPAPTEKPGVIAAVTAHGDRLREWLLDDELHRRSAAAILLARTGALDVLLDAAERERKPAAKASMLLAIGVVARRSTEAIDEAIRSRIDGLWRTNLEQRDALVRLCATTTAALTGATLDDAQLDTILAQLDKPAALPPAWGFFDPRANARSDRLALRVLGFAAIEHPERILAALARVSVQDMRVAVLVEDATLNAAFEARGRARPRHLVVAGELDAIQREAIELLAKNHPTRQLALGLPRPEVVAKLFAKRTLEFRQIPIEIAGETRRWHFARIWAAVVFDEITVEHAAAAVLAGYSTADVVTLATRDSWAREPVYASMTEPAHHERSLALALALLDGAKAAGFDLEPVYRDPKAKSVMPAVLALGYLHQHPRTKLPEDVIPTIVWGVGASKCRDPLHGLLARLPKRSLHAVLEQVRVGGNSLRVLDLWLDAPIVGRLVNFAIGPWASEYRDAVVDVLARGDEATVRALEQLAFDDPDVAALAESVIAEALARIRGRLGA